MYKPYTYLSEKYQKRESWFLEFTGPLIIGNVPHEKRSIYLYKEFLGLYDLNV